MESRGKKEERQGTEEEGKAEEEGSPQSQREDAMRHYATQHVPGAHLNFSQRQILASDWNAIIRAGCRVTLRQFAAKHGLRYETWRREYMRGATGAAGCNCIFASRTTRNDLANAAPMIAPLPFYRFARKWFMNSQIRSR
jgi:hypothetical protein